VTDIEQLLASTYREHEDDVVFTRAVGASDQGRRRYANRFAFAPVLVVGAVAIIAAVVAVLVSSHDRSGSALSGVTTLSVYGAQTDSPLTLRPPGSHPPVKVPESTARAEIAKPFAAPQLAGLVQFGLARVTAKYGLATQSTGITLDNTLAWVGVSRIDTAGGSTSCPAEVPSSPRSLPPEFKHYFFAVIVDATTGAVATWNEDESGLLLRDCGQGG
jgi:hypothetical protein